MVGQGTDSMKLLLMLSIAAFIQHSSGVQDDREDDKELISSREEVREPGDMMDGKDRKHRKKEKMIRNFHVLQ